MKTADDFRRALGEGDEGFHRRVQATLAALPEEEPVVKKKMSVGLAIAFALLMMTMVAAMAANWWGIGDFLKNDNLEGMTQGANVTAETEHATFTVTEHIYDGRGIYMVVAVRPKADNVLMLPQGMDEEAWIGGMVPEAEHMTVTGYAQQQGYTEFVWVAVNTNINVMGPDAPYLSRREHLEEDGTLLIMLSGVKENLPAELNLALDCGSRGSFIGDNSAWQEEAHVSKEQIALTLHANAADEKHWCTGPVVFDELGMTVDEVRMVQTPLAVYYEIDFTAHDPMTNQKDSRGTPGYHFRFLEEDGKPIPFGGVAQQTRYVMLDKEAGCGRWIGTIPSFETMPDTLQLKCYMGWSYATYDATQTLAIPLIPAE